MVLISLTAVIGIIFLLRAKQKKIWHWFSAAFLALVFLGSTGSFAGTIFLKKWLGADKEGGVSHNFAYRSLPDDVQKKLHDNLGKVVVLNLWATWCGPCIEEMPHLNRIQKEFKDKGVTVLAISDETKEEILPYLEENNFEINFGYSSEVPYFKEVLGRPSTYIIDREGIVREVFVGGREYETFSEAVKRRL